MTKISHNHFFQMPHNCYQSELKCVIPTLLQNRPDKTHSHTGIKPHKDIMIYTLNIKRYQAMIIQYTSVYWSCLKILKKSPGPLIFDKTLLRFFDNKNLFFILFYIYIYTCRSIDTINSPDKWNIQIVNLKKTTF